MNDERPTLAELQATYPKAANAIALYEDRMSGPNNLHEAVVSFSRNPREARDALANNWDLFIRLGTVPPASIERAKRDAAEMRTDDFLKYLAGLMGAL